MELWPLQKHELGLLELLRMDGAHLRESAAKILEPCLKKKEDGKALQAHEYRLVGQFAYKAFKATDNNRVMLTSFSRYSPFEIAKLPKFYRLKTTDASSILKTRNNHLAVAKEWMNHLPEQFIYELLLSYLKESPELAKEMIGAHHKNLYRQSAVETLVMQAYCNFNGTQRDKVGRCLSYFSGGLRMTASKHETIALKNDYLLKNNTTLTHEKMMLQKKVSAGKKKGSTIMRGQWTTVSKAHPLENILVKSEGLMTEKSFCHQRSDTENIGSKI